MSINLPPAVFQILLLIGCGHVFRITDCLELNATHGVAFSTNEVAEFYCEIDPYTKSQTWFVNSISVSDCGFIVCAENASNPGRYHFSSNTTIGTFIFKIDPTTSEDNGNVIRCSDGTNYTDIQIAVTVREDVGDDGGGKCSWWCFLIIVVLIVVIAVIVVIILCIMCPRFIESIVTETTIYLRWTKMKCPCCQDSSTDSIVCKTENGEPQKKVLKEKHCTFEKLDPMKEYVINLSSGNECFCIWKKNITTTITTLPAKPNVKIIVGITEIYLDWTNPANPKGAVNQELSYLIICQNKEITTSLDTKYKIVKLSPGKTYTIEVYAIKNKIESSPWTKDLTTLKGISLSLKPSAVLCDINWTAPTVEGSDEFTYMLKYCLVDNGTWITEGKDIRERKFTLNHLELNSVYKIRVYAIYQSKVLDPPGEEEFKTTCTNIIV